MNLPIIIQGGMGAGVSHWRLARSVSRAGHLGVVSGTALDNILARRLQDGDPGGHMRRALARFPFPTIAEKILRKYFIPGGKPAGKPYKAVPMFTLDPTIELQELNVAANFVEIHLAKSGHNGLVGINYLEKIQMPTLSCLYGAMLAGVDYVLMGAGIPRAIPGILDLLSEHADVSMPVTVEGASSRDPIRITFSPRQVFPVPSTPLRRPLFLAIVSSNTLAVMLAKKSSGRVDGFVVEGPTAGGHNAPPREKGRFNDRGEPVYGSRDEVDPAGMKELGLPFWLAGSYGDPAKLQEALEQGAAGVQVGTAFAYCRESGLAADIKASVLRKALAGEVDVYTDPQASPTHFPFKVVSLEGTNSERDCYEARTRVCNLGYLRVPYQTPEGTVGYRCASESPEQYLIHGGDPGESVGRKCLCNGLMANIGLPQRGSDGYIEKPVVTSGDDVRNIGRFLRPDRDTYSCVDVIRTLMDRTKTRLSLSTAPAAT